MEIEISKNLIKALKKEHKNPDYSLRCFVDSVDVSSCKNIFKIPGSIDFGQEKDTCSISDETLAAVRSAFGNSDPELVEVLIWISAFLPEI